MGVKVDEGANVAVGGRLVEVSLGEAGCGWMNVGESACGPEQATMNVRRSAAGIKFWMNLIVPFISHLLSGRYRFINS